MSKQKSKVMTYVFFLYLIILGYVTLFAWDYGSSLGPHGPGGRNYNIIPFKSIIQILKYGTLTMKVDILLGNIVMFMPFGILFPLSFRKLSLRFVIPLALFLSLFIEIGQYMFTLRVSNIDDVMLNTAGASIGLFIYWSYKTLFKKR